MGNKISGAREINKERRRRKEERRHQKSIEKESPKSPVIRPQGIRRPSKPVALEPDSPMPTIDFLENPTETFAVSTPTSISFVDTDQADSTWLNYQPASRRRRSLSGGSSDKEKLKMILPSGDPKEIDRMQRQHYLLKNALKGNHSAPCGSPSNILELGCGNGIWSLEIAHQYPSASVTGVDISPPTIGSSSPKNLEFIRGNILQDFEFCDDKFDLTYQRDMGTVIRSDLWEPYLHEVWRVMAPGSWLQLVETDFQYRSPGPMLELINEWVANSFSARGITVPFTMNLPEYLKAAGFINITKKTVDIPNGEWHRDPDLKQSGFINKGNQKILFRVMRPWYTEELGIEPDDYDQAVAEAVIEFEEYQGYLTWTIMTAQKPFYE